MLRNLCWLTCLVAIGCSRGSDQQEKAIPMSRFQSGQVWQYKTRPGEESSRLTIAKVESNPKLGTIVHIQVTDVAIKSTKAPGGVSKVIYHLPFAEQALTDSVTVMEKGSVTPAGWEDGYKQWKSAYDAGKGGIWSITVSEAVTSMEQILSKQ
jgi:hypothetical protein